MPSWPLSLAVQLRMLQRAFAMIPLKRFPDDVHLLTVQLSCTMIPDWQQLTVQSLIAQPDPAAMPGLAFPPGEYVDVQSETGQLFPTTMLFPAAKLGRPLSRAPQPEILQPFPAEIPMSSLLLTVTEL